MHCCHWCWWSGLISEIVFGFYASVNLFYNTWRGNRNTSGSYFNEIIASSKSPNRRLKIEVSMCGRRAVIGGWWPCRLLVCSVFPAENCVLIVVIYPRLSLWRSVFNLLANVYRVFVMAMTSSEFQERSISNGPVIMVAQLHSGSVLGLWSGLPNHLGSSPSRCFLFIA